MKTRNYLISTVLIIALLINAESQAKTGHSSYRMGNPGLRKGHNTVVTHHRSHSVHSRPGLVIAGRGHRAIHHRSPGISISTPKFHFSASIIPSIRSRYVSLHHHSSVMSHHRPVVVHQPAPVVVPRSTVTVWITNHNGSSTPVVLVREGACYIGPKGERYHSLPTQNQLRALYGLDCQAHAAGEITIYVPTRNGAQLPVTLIVTDDGYLGPKGELYREMPTQYQLQMIYGG